MCRWICIESKSNQSTSSFLKEKTLKFKFVGCLHPAKSWFWIGLMQLSVDVCNQERMNNWDIGLRSLVSLKTLCKEIIFLYCMFYRVFAPFWSCHRGTDRLVIDFILRRCLDTNKEYFGQRCNFSHCLTDTHIILRWFV